MPSACTSKSAPHPSIIEVRCRVTTHGTARTLTGYAAPSVVDVGHHYPRSVSMRAFTVGHAVASPYP